MKVRFNIPYLTGNEIGYIEKAITSRHIAGNGPFAKKIENFFNINFGFKSTFVTTSCTDALEMTSILSNISNTSEVIIPSYTFVSSANAFAFCTIVFSCLGSEVFTSLSNLHLRRHRLLNPLNICPWDLLRYHVKFRLLFQ